MDNALKKGGENGLTKVTLGGAEETRTPDFLRAREALSQLSYSPIVISHYTNKDSYSQLLEVLRNI